jgi:predicted DNA-binding transcriptional regulator AlpA
MPPAARLGKPEEVADYLQKTEKTLRNWRNLGIGPPYIKVEGGAIRYRWSDVEKWLARQRVEPAGAAQPA